MPEAQMRRLFVIDTNVLMHDPAALFHFQEHSVYLPMVVLEELDAGKRGLSEVARNARQVSRLLDDLIGDADHDAIKGGIDLPWPQYPGTTEQRQPGKLYLQTNSFDNDLPSVLPSTKADNSILRTTLALREVFPDKAIILVSKDINLRIKARAVGISAEDYYSDKVLDDVSLLYSGMESLPDDFWDSHGEEMRCWQEEGRTLYKVVGPSASRCHPNQCVYQEQAHDGAPFEAIIRDIDGNRLIMEPVIDYRNPRNSVWGINARNREQNFALNLLLDPNIDFVTLLGTAGTGKTLLTLAAGLVQTMDTKRYREIVMTRVTTPVGEDIGFLPGTEEEKMAPWMGALMDNLEVLTQSDVGGDWGRAATTDLLTKRIKIRSLNFMRGRTFLNRFVIIDEAQNLTSKQMKTLITRAGPGTKLVGLGNVEQIDTPYLSETTSGLTYVVDRFKDWPHSGHIILRRGERSRLADFASENL
jgi:PhoH-like ATPase